VCCEPHFFGGMSTAVVKEQDEVKAHAASAPVPVPARTVAEADANDVVQPGDVQEEQLLSKKLAGSLRKGDYIQIKGHPCQIVEITTAK
jgi:hypothetical protein